MIWSVSLLLHCAEFSSFAVTMGKVSRAAAGGASFRTVPQPLNKYIKKSYTKDNWREIAWQWNEIVKISIDRAVIYRIMNAIFALEIIS